MTLNEWCRTKKTGRSQDGREVLDVIGKDGERTEENKKHVERGAVEIVNDQRFILIRIDQYFKATIQRKKPCQTMPFPLGVLEDVTS